MTKRRQTWPYHHKSFVEAYEVTIPGPPVPKGRPRFTLVCPKGRKPYVRTYTPTDTDKWEKTAATTMSLTYRGDTITGPVLLEVTSVKARPQDLDKDSYYSGRIWCEVVPDGDNILKIASDALVKAKVIEDDGLVVRWTCDTVYTARGERPCVEIRVSVLTDYRPVRKKSLAALLGLDREKE